MINLPTSIPDLTSVCATETLHRSSANTVLSVNTPTMTYFLSCNDFFFKLTLSWIISSAVIMAVLTYETFSG